MQANSIKKRITKLGAMDNLMKEFGNFVDDAIDDGLDNGLDPLTFLDHCMEAFVEMKSEELSSPAGYMD